VTNILYIHKQMVNEMSIIRV